MSHMACMGAAGRQADRRGRWAAAARPRRTRNCPQEIRNKKPCREGRYSSSSGAAEEEEEDMHAHREV